MKSSKRISNKPIFIDALPFAQARKSGIGHITEGLALSLGQYMVRNQGSRRRIYLVVPLGKSKYLRQYVSDNIRIKTIPLPAKFIHILNRYNILPPMDIFLGEGNYIFPNYRNWRLLKSKSFTYIHDLSFLHFRDYVEPRNYGYLSKNIPTWIKRSDVIITASNFTKNEIEKHLHVPSERVCVVAHGVDTNVFRKIPRAEYTTVLKSYGINIEKYILHVGNIEPRKNIRGLVAAYSRLSKKIKEKHALVLIGGDGWLNRAEIEAIHAAIEQGEKIIRPNKYVEDADLPAFYSAASSLVMPSHYEGYGMPPLQAMAVGIPIVVSENSSMLEIFRDAAVLVNPDDTKSIKRGIDVSLKLSREERKKYKEAARKILGMRRWQMTAKEFMRVVERYGI